MFDTIAQENLITNPSFEDIDSCFGNLAPLGFDVFEWSGCDGWSNPIYSSSDLWCQGAKNEILAPPNSACFQSVNDGQNMAGIIIADPTLWNYREYLQNKLKSKLKKDKMYEIRFNVSSCLSFCSIYEIGVKFESNKFKNNSKLDLTNLVPDALNDENNYITDSSGWQNIKLNYLANGYEEFAIFGCFADSINLKYTMDNCDTTFWNGQNLATDYIFFDNFSIIEKESSYKIPNILTLNNDGLNDEFIYEIINLTNWKITFFNRWGNQITFLNQETQNFDFTNLTEGVYYYFLEADELSSNQQGFLTIIK